MCPLKEGKYVIQKTIFVICLEHYLTAIQINPKETTRRKKKIITKQNNFPLDVAEPFNVFFCCNYMTIRTSVQPAVCLTIWFSISYFDNIIGGRRRSALKLFTIIKMWIMQDVC